MKLQTSKYDILRVDKKRNTITLGGEVITSTELKNLLSDIYTLKSLRIWAIFQETIKQYAIDMGFTEAKTMEDVVAGKMLGYAIDVMAGTVDKLEKLGQKM